VIIRGAADRQARLSRLVPYGCLNRARLDTNYPDTQHAKLNPVGIRQGFKGKFRSSVGPDKRRCDTPGYRADHHYPTAFAKGGEQYLGELPYTDGVGLHHQSQRFLLLVHQGASLGYTRIVNKTVQSLNTLAIQGRLDHRIQLFRRLAHIHQQATKRITPQVPKSGQVLLATYRSDYSPSFMQQGLRDTEANAGTHACNENGLYPCAHSGVFWVNFSVRHNNTTVFRFLWSIAHPMRIFFTILLLLLLDWYVYQPFLTSIHGLGRWARFGLIGIYWSIPAISIGLILLYEAGLAPWLPNQSGRSVFLAILVLSYICKLAVVPFVFMDDLRRITQAVVGYVQGGGTHMPSRSRFLSTLGLTMGLLPFTSLLYGMWRNPYRYKVHEVDVPIAGLPAGMDGLRIVQISDIHSGSFTFVEPLENAVRMINDLNPDVVCFTGDLVNNQSREMLPFIPVFSTIRARHGVFSVLGNHDYGDYYRWSDEASKQANFELMLDLHRQLGWRLLRNEHVDIPLGDTHLTVAGVENYSAHPRFHRHGDLDKALSGARPDSLKVLLSHDPSHWDDQIVGQREDIVLTMSGHTHGMQFGIEIPGWIKWSPIQYMYRQWAGLYQKGRQYLYVNRGLGFLGYPGRVGILPEITLLVLRTKV
jgi:predicted MPP superfamily phosphohydrolase